MICVAFSLAIRRSRRAERVALDSYQSARTLGRYPLNWFAWLTVVFPWMRRLHQSPICRSEHWLDAPQKDRELTRAGDLCIDLSGSHECEEM